MTEQCKRASCHRREEQMRARIAELEAERDLAWSIKPSNSETVLLKQLAAYEAVIKQMREALVSECPSECNNGVIYGDDGIYGEVKECPSCAAHYKALSLQPSTEHLDAYVKGLLGEPVAWRYSDNFGEHYTDDRREWYDGINIEAVTPLYALKEQK